MTESRVAITSFETPTGPSGEDVTRPKGEAEGVTPGPLGPARRPEIADASDVVASSERGFADSSDATEPASGFFLEKRRASGFFRGETASTGRTFRAGSRFSRGATEDASSFAAS